MFGFHFSPAFYLFKALSDNLLKNSFCFMLHGVSVVLWEATRGSCRTRDDWKQERHLKSPIPREQLALVTAGLESKRLTSDTSFNRSNNKKKLTASLKTIYRVSVKEHYQSCEQLINCSVETALGDYKQPLLQSHHAGDFSTSWSLCASDFEWKGGKTTSCLVVWKDAIIQFRGREGFTISLTECFCDKRWMED